MTARAMALARSMTAVLTSAVLMTPTAAAASSCVAQSVQAEHKLYGTAWGHDLIAYLATHPEVLAEFGYDSFGDLASYAARQDHANCPADPQPKDRPHLRIALGDPEVRLTAASGPRMRAPA